MSFIIDFDFHSYEKKKLSAILDFPGYKNRYADHSSGFPKLWE